MQQPEKHENVEPLLTYRQAAALIGLPVNSLYQLVHHRRIPHVRLGRRFVRFKRSDLAAWIDDRRVPATEPMTQKASSGDNHGQRVPGTTHGDKKCT